MRSGFVRTLRLGWVAFLIALVGFALNLAGWYLFDSRVVAGVGLLLVVGGVVCGGVAVVAGQSRFFSPPHVDKDEAEPRGE